MPENRIPDISTAMTRLAANTIYPEGQPPEVVTSKDRPRKMALVLSGGGASGAFEAGVIEETAKAMEKHNTEHPDNKLKFDIVIGTSTGALNTYGLLLRSLFKKGLLEQPAWLKNRDGETVNFRLWNYLASFNKKTSKFVLDKTWLLNLIQGVHTWTKIAGILLYFFSLIACFILPDFLSIEKAVLALPTWAGILVTSLGAGLLITTITLLLKKMGLVQRSGRPILVSSLFLMPSFFLLGCLQNILSAAIPVSPWNNVAGYSQALLAAPVLIVLTLLSISGNAIFGNSRLKRLVAAIGDPDSSTKKLRKAVSEKKAGQYDSSISHNVYDSWSEAAQESPSYIFTATNISAEKQGLFLLGSDEDCRKLAENHWLPILIGTEALTGGSVPANDLLTGVIASTAIPATYPPVFVSYQYSGERRHIFVDGGVLDFAAYHTAIDLGCTHILAVETDCMDHDLMQKKVTSNWLNILSNAAAVSYTGSDEEAREEAAHVAKTNRKVVYENLDKKNLILFYRIAPSNNERMINADEFNGRYKDGKQVNTLKDWISYGQKVNPKAGSLPASIWYENPNGEWEENTNIQGPLIWDASFIPSPGFSEK